MSRRADIAPAQLTPHARARIGERFKMSPETLVSALDARKSKRIGVSQDTRIAHMLIWSPADSEHAVAIQNVINGRVITVLTVPMYARTYPRRIQGDILQKTINALVYAGEAPASEWRFLPSTTERAQVFVHTFGESRAAYVGKWRGTLDSPDLSRLGHSKDFVLWLAEQIRARRIDFGSVTGVSAKFPGGDMQDVPLRAF